MAPPTTPSTSAPRGTRASDADRQQVIDFLSEAHASGQLTFDEFEVRSRGASTAVVLEQLSPLTADLQNAPTLTTPHPPSAADDMDPLSTALAYLARPGGGITRALAFLAVAIAALVLIVSGVAAFVAAVRGHDFSDGPTPRLQTAAGFDALVADAKQEFGTTAVDSVTLYPEYAVVSVPVDGHPTHLESFYYDGSFDAATSSGTRDEAKALIDLNKIDGDVLATLVAQAPDALGVADPTSEYAILQAWGDPSQPSLGIYVSDAYDTGSLVAASDGHLLDATPAGGG